MDILVSPTPLSGSLHVPASKSLSHRILIAAGLSNDESQLQGLLESDDIQATKAALRALGVSINNDVIRGGFPKRIEDHINAGASGSTLRFLIPIAMLQDQPLIFEGKDRLPKRSLSIYEDLFLSKGYRYERLSDDHLPVRVQGPLRAGMYKLRGDVSSQFISGLLFALPLLESDSILEIEGPFESKEYVNLTVDVLAQFGITIEQDNQTFHIPGSQKYLANHTTVEGDFSSAAFFLVAGVIGQAPITLHNLNTHSKQGDKEILTILQAMNAKITISDHAITVVPSSPTAHTIDLKDIPDLGPILMVLAALSEGETTFTNIERLRFKESDRVKAMEKTLLKLGANVHVTKKQMLIEGQARFTGNQTFETFDDHRIAMALMIASIKCDNPITIKNVNVINKSYPTFLETFKKLGGKITFTKEGITHE